ncbi:ABC transporter permease [Streptomyces sp. NPDC001843]|uniref:ABC transporter permease n=1 Tax=Streptomyces sp. NPDC001843 TaxID=3364617 RepID=UPI0036C44C40
MSVMTASTSAAGRQRTDGPRLTRWLLRLHRPALLVWAGLVVLGTALLLWLAGPVTDAAAKGWRQWGSCATSTCTYDQKPILLFDDAYTYLTLALAALPFLVAAWTGAALVGREMESGTAQLGWTQGITPARWLTAKLALPAAAVTAGTSLLVLLHRRAWSTADGRIRGLDAWHIMWTFLTNGPTVVAFALVGLAAGAFTGLVLRRALPALAGALVLTAGVWGLAWWLMPRLWPAVTHVTSFKQGYDELYTGLEVDTGLVTATGGHIPQPACSANTSEECRRLYEKLGGVGYYNTFHPSSHFWPLQLTATALVLAIAVLFTVATFLVLRRLTGPLRTAGIPPTAGTLQATGPITEGAAG